MLTTNTNPTSCQRFKVLTLAWASAAIPDLVARFIFALEVRGREWMKCVRTPGRCVVNWYRLCAGRSFTATQRARSLVVGDVMVYMPLNDDDIIFVIQDM